MSPQLPQDFEAAGKAVMAFLRRRLGFSLWMLTRTQGEDWIVLQSDDAGYGVAPGKVFKWADSFCSRMVQDQGPRVAPCSNDIPAYKAAPIGQQVSIRAYIGVPLTGPDGELFGTLCAIDPDRQPDSILAEQELVELLASMLSAILSAELRLIDSVRHIERLTVEATTDALTGLANRRGWDEMIAKEEERCRRYGHAAAVFSIDLDALKQINDTGGHAAGDELIVAAADALRAVARQADVVARLGGDEFGFVAVECDRPAAQLLAERLRREFDGRGVRVSFGTSMRDPSRGLNAAWVDADQRMYEEKRAK